jgi:hypothetical protein
VRAGKGPCERVHRTRRGEARAGRADSAGPIGQEEQLAADRRARKAVEAVTGRQPDMGILLLSPVALGRNSIMSNWPAGRTHPAGLLFCEDFGPRACSGGFLP